MASMSSTNEWLNSNDAHKEYLFLMEKTLQNAPIINKEHISGSLVTKTKIPIMLS